MKHFSFRKQQLILTAALACLPAAAVVGQGGGALEEIIVTAQHREQNVQDVPISVTALGGGQIEAAGIVDATSVAVNVPGLSFAQFAPGQALLSFRGVTSIDDGAGLDNSTATFLDGVYIGRLAGIDFDLFDIERIEALKGPQGTLFGRNAIGGVLNVVTEKPSEEFKAKAAVTVGNYDTLRFQGLASGGFEGLAGKLVVSHREREGFVRNTLLNKDVRGGNQTSLRGQLAVSGEAGEWLLSGDYMEDDQSGLGRFVLADAADAPDYVEISEGLGANRPFTSASPIEGFSNRENKGISLQGDLEVIGGIVTLIGALRNVESRWNMPSVGAPLGGGADLSMGTFGRDVNDDIDEEIDTMSWELRYTSDFDFPLNFVAGFYYINEETSRREQFRIDQGSIVDNRFQQSVVGNEWTLTENETDSYAIYGQANFDVTDQFRLTAGGRYTYDTRDYSASAANCGLETEAGMMDDDNFIPDDAAITAAGLPLSVCTFNGLMNDVNGTRVGSSLRIIGETFSVDAEKSWNDFSPMGSVQFRPNDEVMFFATVSTGYKSGGFAGSQGVEAAASNPVQPEGVINYEAGFKSDLLDRTLRFNLAGFFMDYEDLQVVRFGRRPEDAGDPDAFGTFQTTNAGDAKIYGIEMDFVWQLTDQFRLSGNYAYLNTEVEDLFLPNCRGAENPDTAEGGTDCSGLDLRQAPEHTWSLVAQYTMPVTTGEMDFRAQWTHTDENHHDYPTYTETITEKHDLLDARIEWTSAEGRYKVALWGKNLTDQAYASHAYRVGPGSIGVWGDPRTYGVTATYSY